MANLNRTVMNLRAAACMLEKAEGELRLPGWEDLGEDDTAAPLRAAARAIAADGVDPNVCTSVSLPAVGELVRYIADMLEE